MMFSQRVGGAVRQCFYVFLAFVFFDICDSLLVLKARETAPAPVAVPPTQNWDGNDGPWSTFAFSIGNPPQLLRLLVATSSTQTWAVATEGCGSGDAESCPEDRGSIWDRNNSATYVPNIANSTTDIYTLKLEEHLGYVGKGRYGFDTVRLGWQKGGVELKNQTVVGIATKDYFMGMFGLDPKSSIFIGDEKPVKSYIANLKEQSIIPSLSWAYTAGNPYKSNKVAGSLTLGGYDSSKFIPNNASFLMKEKTRRDLVISIQKITTNSGSTSLLPKSIDAYIDSAIPFIYLPAEACALFEKEFKLTWNESINLYIVSDIAHTALIAKNPSITFQLGDATQSVDISLPYGAFDLTTNPYPEESDKEVKYFPIRKAQKDTQYTLGRTIFQEAYVIADYERGNFSISQCSFNARAAENLVAILPVDDGGNSPAKKTPVPIIAGAVAGGALIIGLLLLYFFWWRPRQRRKNPSELDSTSLYHPLHPNSQRKDPTFVKAELDAGENSISYQGRYGKPVELSEQAAIYEMPANEVSSHEMKDLPPKSDKRVSRLWGRGRDSEISRQNTTDTLGFPRTPIGSLGIAGESSIQSTPAANYVLPVPTSRRTDSTTVGYHDRRTPSPSFAERQRGVSPMRMDSTADSMGFPRSADTANVSSPGNSMRIPLGSPNSRGVSPRESPVISPASVSGSSRAAHYARF